MAISHRLFLFFSLGTLLHLSGCGDDSSAFTGGSGQSTGTGGGSGTSMSNGTGNTTGTSSGGGSGQTTGAGASDAGSDAFTPPPDSYSITFPPTVVSPGSENTQCVVKRLGNPDLLRVNQIHNQLAGGSHHLIVYRTNDTVEQPVPFDCAPFIDTLDPSSGSPLMITQKVEELLTLPQGVAFSLQPDQMIRLEMHYLNATAADLAVSATSTFIPIAESDFMHEADFLFIGNPDINIPAQSMATLGPTFFPPPANLSGVSYFGVTGHTHHWGTNVTIETAPNATGPGTSIYDLPNWLWSEPETVYFDPPLQIPSGGGFRFTCTWNNLGPSPVGFGESANAEMCFFWTYYYPSKGAFVCVHTDQFPGGINMCCPGNALCGSLFP
jgi:hypothetical protein